MCLIAKPSDIIFYGILKISLRKMVFCLCKKIDLVKNEYKQAAATTLILHVVNMYYLTVMKGV
jgi:hypothetical protein